MPETNNPHRRLLLVVLSLSMFVSGIEVARPQDTGDKKIGHSWIHILRQDKDAILFQPIVPPIIGASLDNGTLNGQKLFECDEWKVQHKTEAGTLYPAVEMRCGAISLTVKDLDLTDHQ